MAGCGAGGRGSAKNIRRLTSTPPMVKSVPFHRRTERMFRHVLLSSPYRQIIIRQYAFLQRASRPIIWLAQQVSSQQDVGKYGFLPVYCNPNADAMDKL